MRGGPMIMVFLLFASLSTGAAARDKKPEGKTDAEEAPAWQVDHPPGREAWVAIDTDETTWSNVDVSPDGRTIVFDALGDLYTVPIEGGNATLLTEGMAWDFEPRWSPDGRWIVFVSDRGGANNLWIVNADGTAPRAVTKEKEHLVHTPRWSPDGAWIVAKKDFTSTRSIAAGEIWLFSAGGGEGFQITERPFKERDQKTMAEPAFSVDGRYIFYSQDVTPGVTWEYNKDATGEIFDIKRLDRTTGEVETFVGGPGGAVRPTPSPDGRYLAFVRRAPTMASALYLKDLESGREWPIDEHLDRDLQETFGSQGIAPAFSWTPDARAVVYWAGGHIHACDVASRAVRDIPVHVAGRRAVRPALRFPIEVAPTSFDVRMPRWSTVSPDGRSIVLQALGSLWVRDVQGGAPRRLTGQTNHFELYPAFSRDGRWIVYVTWNDDTLGSVRVIPASGGASRIVTREPGIYVEPSFSPDGRTIVYRKITGGSILSREWSQEPGCYTVDAGGGGEPRRIAREGVTPQFGATSDRIYLAVREEGKTLLKSVNLEGRDPRTHLTSDDVTEFSLSPDGRWCAFTQRYDAWVAPFTSTGRPITIGADIESIPVSRISRRAGVGLHWSSDSRAVHWSHGPTLYTRSLADAFAFLEGAPVPLPEPLTEGRDLRFPAATDIPGGRIAIVGGRVVTMRGARATPRLEEVIPDGVVIVSRNRVEAVGPRDRIRVPEDAFVLDAQGKTIVPGFIDVHAHGPMATSEIVPQQNWEQYANLAFGVTTIHDPSNDTSSIFAAAEMQRAGVILAPRIFSTGTILYGAHIPGATADIANLDDARFHVRRMKEVGAISVKSYQQPRREQRQQILAAAREMGIMVVPEGGGKFQNNMNMIVDGHTGIEHSLSIAAGYEDVLQLWSGTDVGYTPTLVVAFGGLSGENWFYEHDDVWKNERLMRYTPRFEVEPRAMRRTRAPENHYNHIEVARFAKRLLDRGVSVQIGAHGQRAGLAAHWEMWMLEQGGFTPWEAIRAATLDGARYVGLEGDVGSIERGKLADLVVIDGDPIADLRRSEFVAYVMLNGRLYDATTMNQIAPERVERKPFFFSREGGDTIHPATP